MRLPSQEKKRDSKKGGGKRRKGKRNEKANLKGEKTGNGLMLPLMKKGRVGRMRLKSEKEKDVAEKKNKSNAHAAQGGNSAANSQRTNEAAGAKKRGRENKQIRRGKKKRGDLGAGKWCILLGRRIQEKGGESDFLQGGKKRKVFKRGKKKFS